MAPSRIALCGRDGPGAMRIDSIGARDVQAQLVPACPVGMKSGRSRFVQRIFTAELAKRAAVRRLARVDQREEDFGADVARARTFALAAIDGQARLARGAVVGDLRLPGSDCGAANSGRNTCSSLSSRRPRTLGMSNTS